jgi:Probable cobalt transporter subunit (CbtA)
MEGRVVIRGVLVGALGGLLMFIFARIFAEPVIDRAIAYESGRDEVQAALDKAAGLPPEPMGPDIFSRTIQQNVGIAFGLILFGIAMGALFAVVYSVAVKRVGNVSPRNLTLLVAGGMFLGMYLVPSLKYPANPPSIGHPETIAPRGGLYLLMVGCSLLFLLGAVILGRRLAPRFGNWNAGLLAAAAFVVAIGVVMLLLPSYGHLSANVAEYGPQATETPQPLRNPAGTIVYPRFSADDLYAFRLYSVGNQLILWATIGLCFAPFADRLFGASRDSRDVHASSL